MLQIIVAFANLVFGIMIGLIIAGSHRDGLYEWQTLIGSVFAALTAVAAAGIAWVAAMKQISAAKSERDRRAQYAANVGRSYLHGMQVIAGKIAKTENQFSEVTEGEMKNAPGLVPALLALAQDPFLEPNPFPNSDDVEQYREELPLALFGNLRLVFRLAEDLKTTIAESLAQQNVYGAFPLEQCQERVRDALSKLEEAIDSAEESFDRFIYE